MRRSLRVRRRGRSSRDVRNWVASERFGLEGSADEGEGERLAWSGEEEESEDMAPQTERILCVTASDEIVEENSNENSSRSSDLAAYF